MPRGMLQGGPLLCALLLQATGEGVLNRGALCTGWDRNNSGSLAVEDEGPLLLWDVYVEEL